jgi:hypothetical protein
MRAFIRLAALEGLQTALNLTQSEAEEISGKPISQKETKQIWDKLTQEVSKGFAIYKAKGQIPEEYDGVWTPGQRKLFQVYISQFPL